MAASEQPNEPGMSFFSSSHYRIHNEARLQHLASLGLPLAGRVLEVGSGPGDHTGFYLERGCSVMATDARDECLQALKARYPMVEVRRVDMNRPDGLTGLGVFEIVHCYGLLYHLEVPEAAIAAMSRVCGNLLLLETCVSAGVGNFVNIVRETPEDFTQAKSGSACRPTRSWVFDTLKKYFPFVYQTKTQPHHAEFPIDWTAVRADHGLVRVVLVASRRPYDLPVLSPVLLDHQERSACGSRAEIEVRDAALEDLRGQLERANAAILQLQWAAEESGRCAQSLEAAQDTVNHLRAEISAFRKQGFLRYLLYCWKNR